MEQNTNEQTKGINQLFKVGDILKYQWGYDQTNVNFYKVINLRGKTQVQIRELKSNKCYSQSMIGTTTPLNEYDSDKVLNRKVRLFGDKPVIDLEYGSARLWSGEPISFTEYS